MSSPRSQVAYVVVPLQHHTVGRCPLEDIKVPLAGRLRARARIPRASISASVPQNGQMPLLGGTGARCRIPRTTVGASILEDIQMPSLCSARARRLAPRAAPRSRAPQDPRLPQPRGGVADGRGTPQAALEAEQQLRHRGVRGEGPGYRGAVSPRGSPAP